MYLVDFSQDHDYDRKETQQNNINVAGVGDIQNGLKDDW